VSTNLAPESYPQTFSPPTPVKYVLEINAGQAAQFGVEAGDEVNLYSPEVPI
jgi:uncharacterized membrane protein (UPF0127 family)